MEDALEFETDDRGRISIARFGEVVKGRKWLGTMEDDGTVILRPATLLSDDQLRFLHNPGALTAVDSAFQGAGVPMKRDRSQNRGA